MEEEKSEEDFDKENVYMLDISIIRGGKKIFRGAIVMLCFIFEVRVRVAYISNTMGKGLV